MSRKFLIVCGGTGGHLAPGIAVAEELLAKGNQVSLLISTKQVDSRLVRKYGHLDFIRLPGAAFGKRPSELLRFFKGFMGGFVAGSRVLRRVDPDLVLAFGGFLSLGVVLPAFLRKIPVALHEANRRPGRSIRLLKRFANRLYLPKGLRLKGVPVGKIRHYGYPVRREFRRLPQRAAREKLGLPVDGFLLVVFGGSQGASALNDWVDSHYRDLLGEGMDIYCIRGLGKGSEGVLEQIDSNGATRRFTTVGFCDSMHWVLSAGDLAVSRAGAGSIAELTCCALPSVLVPFPFAADDHQLANARFFESQGACVVLEQMHLSSLFDEIRKMRHSPELLETMRENLELAADAERKEDLVADLEKLADVKRLSED